MMATSRQRRSEAKRDAILKIATELFLAEGYDQVSVDDIVARAGGSKTNIYKHFGGKGELFMAVVEELCRQTEHSFAQLDLEALDPDQALRQIGRRFLATLFSPRSVRQRRLLVAEAPRFRAAGKRWLKAVPEGARASVAAYFHKLQRAGHFRGIAPRRLAGIFLDMLGEEQLLRQLITGTPPPGPRELNKLVDDAVYVFLHGVLVT